MLLEEMKTAQHAVVRHVLQPRALVCLLQMQPVPHHEDWYMVTSSRKRIQVHALKLQAGNSFTAAHQAKGKTAVQAERTKLSS